ncbi:MAG: malto-oligosyltrehalose synthase [Bryobacteraceae bacterium]
MSVRVPCSTYRLQLNHEFTFCEATGIVPYLHDLGITDCYVSPILTARPGSMHGYDVVDHSQLNPEIGTRREFDDFSDQLTRRGMGLVADVVPNHMCVASSFNHWWLDVLENGPSSIYSRYFDIDWHPPKPELANKVLLPVLGDQYGRVLENQELHVTYEDGAFHVSFYGATLPVAPRAWPHILELTIAPIKQQLGESHEHELEMESIITALHHLPRREDTEEEKIRERMREKEVIKRRLAVIHGASVEVRDALAQALATVNGQRGDPHSFDRLEALLDDEPYRLSFWRVAADEINYRRFFDINDLAAIRVEDLDVFAATHRLIFELVREKRITGLRIDHPDGLYDPEQYFEDVQNACRREGQADARPIYMVIEKIFMSGERMRQNWTIHGSTGYGYLNLLNGVFVDRTRERAFEQLYSRFTGWSGDYEDLVHESKRLILQVSMSSELNMLSRKLDCISEQHRWSRDFTLENLRDALREVITSFPVYRSYIRYNQTEVHGEDRRYIEAAISDAKRRNRAMSEAAFEFIQHVLLLENPEGLTDEQNAERKMFVMRFQQLTSPVMAKGVEDTAFYRYYPLASLNEVGGHPRHFGSSVTYFHRKNLVRQSSWPYTLNATSTHDTKRGEDVRARINVLSEMPAEWYRTLGRWTRMNREHKTIIDGQEAPDANEEYLLYQTLLGSWPLGALDAAKHGPYVERIQRYTEKALREAKVHTSWVSPNQAYEGAVRKFVDAILGLGEHNRFLRDFREFQAPISSAGMWNSLSQTLLKITSPGVPDFYQGTELWAFQLVDPDNRGEVDYKLRRKLLEKIDAASDLSCLADQLIRNPEDGALKLLVMSRALRFRRANHDLYRDGEYAGLMSVGAESNRVIAFARTLGNRTAITIAGRFFLNRDARKWGDTGIVIPRRLQQQRYRDAITGRVIEARRQGVRLFLPVEDAFAVLPVALLSAQEQ